MIKALKGCRFGGRDYSAGDIVPDSAVDKKAIGSLKMLKIISVTEDRTPIPTPEAPPKIFGIDEPPKKTKRTRKEQ